MFALGIGSSKQDAQHLLAAFKALCDEHSMRREQAPHRSLEASHTHLEEAITKEDTSHAGLHSPGSRIEYKSSSGSSSRGSSMHTPATLPSTGLGGKSFAGMSPRDAFFAPTMRSVFETPVHASHRPVTSSVAVNALLRLITGHLPSLSAELGRCA